jgi:hypothetical protein
MYFSSDPKVFQAPKICNLGNGTTLWLNGTSRRNIDCTCATPFRADPDFASDTIIAVFIILSGLTVLVALVPFIYTLLQSWRSNKSNVWHWIDDIFTLRLGAPESYAPSESRTAAERAPNASKTAAAMRNVVSPRQSVLSDFSELEKYLPESNLQSPPPSAVSLGEPPRAEPTAPAPQPIQNKSVIFAQGLLVPLCNIQIFAGIIWVIWGYKKWPSITYYHEQFVVNFWWLTLTSVWIARVDLVSFDSRSGFRSHMQRVTILVSVALASAFQIMVAKREHNKWDPTVHGLCYLTRDGSGEDLGQNLLWIIGTIFYGIALFLTLFEGSRDKLDRWLSDPLDRVMNKVGLMVHNSYSRTYHQKRTESSALGHFLAKSYGVIEIICFGSVWLAWWCLVQFMSIWGAGNGSIVVETGAYIVFAASSMFYIISMKLDNMTLVVGPEDTVTLGPVVLILMSAGLLYTYYAR